MNIYRAAVLAGYAIMAGLSFWMAVLAAYTLGQPFSLDMLGCSQHVLVVGQLLMWGCP